MDSLEAKVPPVVWFAAAGILIWVIASINIDSALEHRGVGAIGVVITVVGAAFGVAGVARFGRAGTTVNPHSIERASALVTSGVYRFTRNPMYLGLLLVLIGWGAWNGSVVALVLGAVGFIAVMNRLQIRPEERVLAHRFGDGYTEYSLRVRRWI